MKTLFLFFAFVCASFAGDLVVVVSKNSTIEQLSRQELKAIYLKKKLRTGDTKLIPVNLAASNPTRPSFDKLVLMMESYELGQHWNKLHFNGINPPLVQNSFEGVKAFVKNVEGAIGYIDSENVDSGLKIVATIR